MRLLGLVGLAGLVMLGVGLWQFDPRTCLVTVGGIVLAVAVLDAVAQTLRRPPP